MTSPEITVLMPVYNGARYIAEAVNSVLLQDFTDFELLIINDGSTDNTLEIIRQFNDSRIRVVTQSNQGVIGALNNGLQLASGEYIARFDADDICYPYRLSTQIEYMKTHPDCVLVGSAADYIDKDGNYLFEWQPSAYTTEELRQSILKECPFDHPTVMYRKDVAIELGGYPQGAIHFEDHLFWTQFFKKGALANLKQPLIRHRFNPESVTIDEKWRGKIFAEIKYRSINRQFISPDDVVLLKEILKKQDFAQYKEAAYYSMVGKKFLWNNHQPAKAREHFKKAIKSAPYKPEPYLLYLMSFLPESVIRIIYKTAKR